MILLPKNQIKRMLRQVYPEPREFIVGEKQIGNYAILNTQGFGSGCATTNKEKLENDIVNFRDGYLDMSDTHLVTIGRAFRKAEKSGERYTIYYISDRIVYNLRGKLSRKIPVTMYYVLHSITYEGGSVVSVEESICTYEEVLLKLDTTVEEYVMSNFSIANNRTHKFLRGRVCNMTTVDVTHLIPEGVLQELEKV